MQSQAEKRTLWIRSALDRFQAPLVRYALRITGDLERARDIVQDTFLQLCRADRAQIRDHLAEWLFTVCRNRALVVRRKESRMTTLTEVQTEPQTSSQDGPLARAEREDDLRRVLRIMEELPPRQQELLRLKFQNELSYKEISRITSLSVSNVGFLLHTALKRVRQQIEAQEAASRSIRRVK